MRFLRTGRLIPSNSGLWAVDEFPPVAAVLHPASGAVLDVVSWTALPAAPAGYPWPAPAVRGDGTSLWTQQQPSGPLVRVGAGGEATAVWTDGLEFAACGPGEAWCAPQPPGQELVHGSRATPMTLGQHMLSTLLRVREDGRQDTVTIDRPVRRLSVTAGALVIEVDDEPWTLGHLGENTYEVRWTSRYVSVPWGSELPRSLTVGQDLSSRQRPPGVLHEPTDMAMAWYEFPGDPRGVLSAAGLRWRLGRIAGSATDPAWPWHPLIATAHDDTDDGVGRYELGPGTITAATGIAGNTAVGVAVRRPGATHPVEVVALHPDRNEVVTLLSPDDVDITDRCWPLVPRPIETDSYERPRRIPTSGRSFSATRRWRATGSASGVPSHWSTGCATSPPVWTGRGRIRSWSGPSGGRTAPAWCSVAASPCMTSSGGWPYPNTLLST